jgi:hypothetical protein
LIDPTLLTAAFNRSIFGIWKSNHCGFIQIIETSVTWLRAIVTELNVLDRRDRTRCANVLSCFVVYEGGYEFNGNQLLLQSLAKS